MVILIERGLFMANVEKITIALTPDLSSLVRNAVEKGDYASTSEVIRDALRDWKIKRALAHRQIEELICMWQEGIESGPGRFDSMEEIIQEAKNRFKADRIIMGVR
jgi:antitoxin ParD1/3/4